MIDPNIALATQTPKPLDPIASISGLMSLRDLGSQIALRNAQTQQASQVAAENAALAEQKNRDLADQNTIQGLEKDPGAYADIHSGDPAKIGQRLGGLVQPKTVQAVQDYVNKQIEQKATLDTATLKNQQDAHGAVAKTVDSLDQMKAADGTPDFDRINEQLPNAIQSLAPELRILGIDPATVPKSIHTEDDWNTIKGRVAGLGALTDTALARKGEQAKALQAQAAATESTAKGNEAQATADLNNYKLNLMKGAGQGDPAARAAQVKGMSIFAGHPQEAQDAADAGEAAYQAALKSSDPTTAADKAQAAVKDVADRLRAFSPGVTAGKVNEARVMIPVEAQAAAAKANAEIGPHVNEQVQASQALAKQSPDAFVAIPNAAARNQAINDAAKIQTDYGTVYGQTKQLLDTIRAEQSGNKAAGAALTVEQARSLIQGARQLGPVLHQVSGQSGNLIDHLEGGLKGLAGTDKLPDAVVSDMATLAPLTIQAAARNFQTGLDGLKIRGVDITKIPPPSIVTNGHSVGDVVKVGGKNVKISAIHPDGSFDGDPQ
jgi:hypothetical protein